MDRKNWMVQLEDLLRRGKGVAVFMYGLAMDEDEERPPDVVVQPDGTVWFQMDMHLTEEGAFQSSLGMIPKDRVIELAQKLRRFNPRMDRLVIGCDLFDPIEIRNFKRTKDTRKAIALTMAKLENAKIESPILEIRVSNEVRQSVIAVYRIPRQVDYRIPVGRLVVQPGSEFTLDGLHYRVGSVQSVIGSQLSASMRYTLNSIFNQPLVFRTYTGNLLKQLAGENVTGLDRIEQSGWRRYEKVTIPALLINPISISSIVAYISFILADIRLSKYRLRLMGMLDEDGRDIPTIKYPLSWDSKMWRIMTPPSSTPDLDTPTNLPIWYHKGQLYASTKYLRADVVRIDCQTMTAQFLLNKHLGQVSLNRPVPIRPSGSVRFLVRAVPEGGGEWVNLPLYAKWNSYEQLVTLLYRHFNNPEERGVYDVIHSSRWLENVVYAASPLHPTILELATLHAYLRSGQTLALLETSLPGWKPSYSVALRMRKANEATMEDLSDAIEWALDM